MKATSLLLIAAAMMAGSACSSSTTASGTTGSSTSGSTVTDDASSGMTSGAATSPGTSGSGTMNTSSVGTSSSVSSTGVSSGSMNVSGSTASSATVGTPGTDMNAFVATFATMDDPTFLMTAASSNMLEIQLGQMATQQSTDADVKKYGQMMKDHHTKATQELKTVAAPLNVTLPTTLMPVHQALADNVKGKTGKAFDEAYMDAMETAHKMDIAMFEAKTKQASTPSVKALATKTLPMLNSHKKMADDIEKKVD